MCAHSRRTSVTDEPNPRERWAAAHCVTLVSDITAGLLIASLGADAVAQVSGIDALNQRTVDRRTIVSHFRNINAVHRFHWWRDGRLLVDFDMLFPTERFGADPDALLDDLHAVGIPLDAESDEIAGIDLRAAGFALAQRITGVACTSQLYEESDYLVAVIATPDVEDEQRYGEALRATWHTPTTW